jgi:hypothetical protein
VFCHDPIENAEDNEAANAPEPGRSMGTQPISMSIVILTTQPVIAAGGGGEEDGKGKEEFDGPKFFDFCCT